MKDLPAQLKQDILSALIDRGIAQRQLQTISKKHGRAPEELQGWLTTTLLGLKETVAGTSGRAGGRVTSAAMELDTADLPTEVIAPSLCVTCGFIS